MDPVVTAALIVVGLQTIVSRPVDLPQDAAVVTVGTIRGGLRSNVIPADAELSGTIRTLNRKTQEQLLAALRRTVNGIAGSAGTTAEVRAAPYSPATFNDRALTARMAHAASRRRGGGKRDAKQGGGGVRRLFVLPGKSTRGVPVPGRDAQRHDPRDHRRPPHGRLRAG